MVKILQAYNFSKQNTFALNGEILAATLIDSNRIAISSAEQFIEIYDIVDRQQSTDDKDDDNEDANLPTTDPTTSSTSAVPTTAATASNDEKLPVKYTLATVGEVVNLIYCEAGSCLSMYPFWIFVMLVTHLFLLYFRQISCNTGEGECR